MRRAVVWGVVAAALTLVLLDAAGARLGLVDGLWPRASGSWAWVLARAAGVAAWVALGLDVGFGLLLSTGLGDAWVGKARGVDAHRFLASATLWLLGLHGLLLVLDPTVRFDALAVLVPGASPWRPVAVTLGVVAGWSLVGAHAGFALRTRLGPRAWRWLHAASFPAFALATAHLLLAGTDAGSGWLLSTVGVVSSVIGAGVAVRLGRLRARGRAPA